MESEGIKKKERDERKRIKSEGRVVKMEIDREMKS